MAAARTKSPPRWAIPQRLARELRAEVGFRRWEENRSAGNFVGVVLALLGLATLDFIFLLPFLLALAAIFFGLACGCLGCIIGGTFLLFNSAPGRLITA